MQEQLLAGVGRVDVTPALGTRLGGYAIPERPAERVHNPLHATSLLLRSGDETVALVSLDWLLIEEEDVAAIRAGVQQQTGIKPENVTVCTIQAHTSPFTIRCFGWGDKDTAYIQAMTPRIVESVVQAASKLEPAKLGVTTTHSEVGVNRRGIGENGGVGFEANPWGPYDPTMTVLRVAGESGEPLATVVHYGAHPTAMGQGRVISRDWPGVMVDRVESQTGAPVLFVNGAVGDVGPRMNLMVNGRLQAGAGDGPAAVMEVGYRAATDALRAYVAVKDWRQEVEVATLTRELELPYQPLPDEATARKALAGATAGKDQWGGPLCEYLYWQAVVEALGREPVKARKFTQTVTQIGPVAIVPMPGEPFAEIVLRIRQASPFAHTLVAGTSNGHMGYLATRESRHRGGYEVWAARAFGAYLLADSIDDVLVEQNLRLLRELAERMAR
jgi:neutral ceramidase